MPINILTNQTVEITSQRGEFANVVGEMPPIGCTIDRHEQCGVTRCRHHENMVSSRSSKSIHLCCTGGATKRRAGRYLSEDLLQSHWPNPFSRLLRISVNGGLVTNRDGIDADVSLLVPRLRRTDVAL